MSRTLEKRAGLRREKKKGDAVLFGDRNEPTFRMLEGFLLGNDVPYIVVPTGGIPIIQVGCSRIEVYSFRNQLRKLRDYVRYVKSNYDLGCCT